MIPTVAGHIFQARPVWIYTQSNITNIIFTWVHNTNTEKILVHYVLQYPIIQYITNISMLMTVDSYNNYIFFLYFYSL
jgi:hypothetical protein